MKKIYAWHEEDEYEFYDEDGNTVDIPKIYYYMSEEQYA